MMASYIVILAAIMVFVLVSGLLLVVGDGGVDVGVVVDVVIDCGAGVGACDGGIGVGGDGVVVVALSYV